MSAMYSKNGIIINKNGTTSVATIKSEDGTVKVDTTTLPNGVQYDLSVNTDIIATNEYVYAQVDKEAKSRSHEDELIRNSIPTKTSQIINDSGFFNTNDIYNGRLTIHLTPLQKYSNYLDIDNLSTRFSGYIDNNLRMLVVGTSIRVIKEFTPEYSNEDGLSAPDWPAIAYFEIPNFVAAERMASYSIVYGSLSVKSYSAGIICNKGSNKFGLCLNHVSITEGWYNLVPITIMY